MKSMLRLGLLVAVVAMLVYMPAVTPVRAQDGACATGLSADDCALLEKAAGNSGSVAAFVMESYAIKFSAAGLPEPTPSVNFEVTGAGAVDASAVVVDPADPNSIFKGLKFAMTMDAKVDAGAAMSQAGTAEIRIVDGYIYLKASQMGDTWQKVDLATAMAAGQAGAGGLPVNPQMAQGLAENPAIAAFLEAMNTIPDVITAEAKDGPEIDGIKTREFVFTINLQALVTGLTSEEFRPQLKALVEGLGGTVKDSDLQQLAGLAMMLSTTLEKTTVTVSEYIDAESANVHGLAINFSTVIDAALVSMAVPGSSAPITVDFAFDVKMSKLGEPVTVEAVADAVDMSATPAK